MNGRNLALLVSHRNRDYRIVWGGAILGDKLGYRVVVVE